MGKLIKFSEVLPKSPGIPRELANLPLKESVPAEGAILSSHDEDQAFLDLVHEWPCFQELEPVGSLHELFELYYDDELTLSQDCVLEFVFHMHDPSSAFDIGNAIYTWEQGDRSFFMLSLNLHSELIDQIKSEEL